MHILSKLGLLTAGLVVTGATSVAIVAAAPNSHANAAANMSSTTSTDARARVATRLAEVKLRVCQRHETVINNIMGRIAKRGQRHLDLFSTIATRVETFYTDKGKSLSNYDALVADVNAKKAAAQTEVDTVKSTSVTFKCDGTDPKGVASSFKDELKAEISALKAYKTSVKNLIVGVKSAEGSTPSTNSNTSGGTQ